MKTIVSCSQKLVLSMTPHPLRQLHKMRKYTFERTGMPVTPRAAPATAVVRLECSLFLKQALILDKKQPSTPVVIYLTSLFSLTLCLLPPLILAQSIGEQREMIYFHWQAPDTILALNCGKNTWTTIMAGEEHVMYNLACVSEVASAEADRRKSPGSWRCSWTLLTAVYGLSLPIYHLLLTQHTQTDMWWECATCTDMHIADGSSWILIRHMWA